MEYEISVLIPSIRPHLLEGVYNSIAKSSSMQSWELIIISPYPLPETIKDKQNVTYIYDAGTPIRGRQRGLMAAKGNYICYAADDVTFYSNSLDIAYNSLRNTEYKTLVLGKYLEGTEDNPFMKSDEYYLLFTHDFLKPVMANFPIYYKLLNTGLISTKLMLEIGGFDCSFEACAMACCDLSIRLQNYDVKIIVQQEPIFHSTHLPYGQGDHEPIHNAQVTHDQPRFLSMYLNSQGTRRTIINIDNWKDAPDWWSRRYGNRENA